MGVTFRGGESLNHEEDDLEDRCEPSSCLPEEAGEGSSSGSGSAEVRMQRSKFNLLLVGATTLSFIARISLIYIDGSPHSPGD